MNKVFAGIFVTILSFFGSCGYNSVQEDEQITAPDKYEGLDIFFERVQKFPDSIQLYEILIDTLANRGLFMEAASWCDSAMKHEPYYAAGWLLARGDLFRMAKLYDSAISSYKRYLHIFPDDEQILLNLANALAENGDSSALFLSNTIASQFPSTETRASTAFINGIYYTGKKNFELAYIWYDSAISLKYTFTEAWMERGYCLYDLKKYSEAEKNFKQLTALNKGNAEAWYWLGKTNEAMGKTDLAIQFYSRSFSLDRNITDAKRGLERLNAKKDP